MGKLIVLFVVALIFVLAVVAVLRGYKGTQTSKTFCGSKKMQFGLWLASLLHLWAGAVIILCYLLVAAFLLLGRFS